MVAVLLGPGVAVVACRSGCAPTCSPRQRSERTTRSSQPWTPGAGHPRGYFASATFEIDHNQIEHGHKVVSARVHTANLNGGEPVDLSAVKPS
jgi:hypothetical protein